MKVFLNWSGGKDAAFCLQKLKEKSIPVSALVTTMNTHTNRISMHGVCRALLEEQARCIGLPLHTVELPGEASMLVYEEAIHHQNKLLKAEGFSHVASGDLFLEDLKIYRENLYARDGIECLFPIWEKDTGMMLRQFIELGFKALIVCVNASVLDKS